MRAVLRRGRTVMTRVMTMRDKGIKIRINWNDKGQPIGSDSTLLAGFIGVIVRKHIPITLTDWRYAPKPMRASIWKEINVSFFYTKSV